MMRLFLFFITLILVSGNTYAERYHVRVDGDDSNDGKTWTNAFQTLSKAAAVVVDGDEIWVANGTYVSHVSFINVDVSLYGGFDSDNPESNISDRDFRRGYQTIIDGEDQPSGPIIRIEGTSGDHSSVIIDGFVITGGRGFDGGGMSSYLADIQLRNLVIRKCHAGGGGGGIICSESNIVIENMIVEENSSGSYAGGICITRCPSVDIKNLTVRGNVVDNGHGGGMYIFGSIVRMTNAIISGNKLNASSNALYGGSGIQTYDSDVILTNITIAGNYAPSVSDGAISNMGTTKMYINNSIIWGNTNGGVVNCWNYGVYYRHSLLETGSGSIDNNSEIYTPENSYGYYNDVKQTANAYFDGIEPSLAPISAGSGTIYNADEIFGAPITNTGIATARGDYRLKYDLINNPAISMGDETLFTAVAGGLTTDLDGKPRVQDGFIDLGAYEARDYCTVTFMHESAFYDERYPDRGEPVYMPIEPVKTNWLFKYWYEENSGDEWDFNDNVMNSMTLISKLNPMVTVTLLTSGLNFFDGGSSPFEAEYGENFLLKIGADNGYFFRNLTAQSEGTIAPDVIEYNNGSIISATYTLENVQVPKTVTIEAERYYKVTLYSTEGEFSSDVANLYNLANTGADASLIPGGLKVNTTGSITYQEFAQPTLPIFLGYSLSGWFTELNGAGTRWLTTSPQAVAASDVTDGELKLYAYWEANPYEIKFWNNDGTTNNTIMSVVYDQPILGVFPVPVRTGYTFNGWFTTATGGTRYTDAIYKTPYDLDLYARWTANKYTITFDANDGDIDISSKVVTFDDAVGTLPVPTRIGYYFDGWFDDSNNKYVEGTIYKVAHDIILDARWIVIPPIVIISQPNDAVLCQDISQHTISIRVEGDAPVYQWYRYDNDGAEWKTLPGETRDSYTIYNIQPGHSALYKVIVTGAASNTVESNVVRVRVTIPLPSVLEFEKTPSVTLTTDGTYAFSVKEYPDVMMCLWSSSNGTVIFSSSQGRSVTAQFTKSGTDTIRARFIHHCLDNYGEPVYSFNDEHTLLFPVSVDNATGLYSIDNKSLSVSPNPTSGRVIASGLKVGESVYLYNLSGVQVAVYTAIAEEMTLDLSGLQHGIYFLRTHAETVKIIKK